MLLEECRTIAVVQLGRLGDTVLTTPLLHALRGHAPDATVTVVASGDGARLLQEQSDVDETLVVGRGLPGLGRALMRLRRRTFDLYIDPKNHRSQTSRWLAHAA